MSLLEIENLTVQFKLAGKRVLNAVDDVSLTIEAGEVLGLVGESGSGKSSLGKALVGLNTKAAGQVRYAGELLPRRYKRADFRRWARKLQMIFQDPYASLNPRITVAEILREPLLNSPLSAVKKRELASSWLAWVGLNDEHLGRYPHEFSGGQRQRIGIARALIGAPEFVVCDEAVSALDVSVQAQVINLLVDLQRELQLTLLFIAHDLAVVRHIADRVAVMYLGAIVEEAASEDLFTRPLHPYTQLLLASAPKLDVGADGIQPPVQGEIPSPFNLPEGCRFADRCPEASARCRQAQPEMIAVEDGRRVACFLYP